MSKLFIKVQPLPSSPEERADHIIKFKIGPYTDWKSAKDYYQKNINKQIDLELTLDKWRKIHTKSQRGLFHAVIKQISLFDGTDPEIIKEGIKRQYGVTTFWGKKEVPKPSRLQTTIEYSRLIDGAFLEAAEMGVEIKDLRHEFEEWKRKNIHQCAECGEYLGSPEDDCPRCKGQGLY